MADFDSLEAQKKAILGRVHGWSASRLAYRQTPESWSAVEMFDHIMRSERAILERLPDGVLHPRKLGLRDRIGYRFLHKVFSGERQVKAPSSVTQIIPSKETDLPTVCSEWDQTRIALAEFLKSPAADETGFGIFRHPVSGWMTLSQVLGFFEVHIVHHEFQLARIAEASAGL